MRDVRNLNAELLSSHCNKEIRYLVMEVKQKKVKRSEVTRESNPGHLACAASALPLSYDNQATTSPHNLVYVLHRWN